MALIRFLIIFCFSLHLYAGNTPIDSLKKQLNSNISVTKKVSALNQLAQLYLNQNPDSSIYFSKQALLLSRENKLELDEANSLDNMGLAYYNLQNYKDAVTCLLSTLPIYSKVQDTEQLGINYNRIGAIYHTIGILDRALNYFLKALNIFNKTNNQTRLIHVYNNLGLVYKDMDNTDEAFNMLQKSLSLSLQTNDSLLMSYTYNNLGIVYKNFNLLDRALESYLMSYKIKQELNETKTLANTIGNIGEIYFDKKDYKQALSYYEKANEYNKKNKNVVVETVNSINMGRLYSEINDNRKAEFYLLNAIDFAKKYDLYDLLSESYNYYSDFFLKNNRPKEALQYFKMHTHLKDSILNEKKTMAMVQFQQAYEHERTFKENELHKYRQNIAEQALEKSDLYFNHFLVFLIFVFILLIVIFILYKIHKKRNNIISIKNNEIEKYNEELTQINFELEKRVEERTQEITQQIIEKEKVHESMITALKRAEDANSLKDAFLVNINHEIRTPLSAVLGLSEVLKSKNENKEIQHYINGIYQSANRLHSLLNNIIDFSRVQANDLQMSLSSCQINEIVINVVELFRFKANEKKLNLELFLGNTPPVVVDNSFIAKVFTDIMDNSIKYTNNGGVEVHTGVITNSHEVFIKFVDSGIGIDEAYISQVFESFSQESSGYARLYQGAGLGLPLAKRLVSMMNGRIELSSRKNIGTTVTVFLPADIEKYQSGQKISYETATIIDSGNKKDTIRILVVEDDSFNAMFISAILEGFADITLADCGEKALELIETDFDKGVRFDMVIVDINLPGKWDGITLMQFIKKNYAKYISVPFIAQTAYSLNSEFFKLSESGFNEVIVKPIDSSKLQNTVKKYLFRK